MGLRNLQQASELTKTQVDVEWLPFFLNPKSAVPEEGQDLFEHISQKYGPEMAQRFSGPTNPLTVAGAKVGIVFNNRRKMIRTERAHSLMEWANRRSTQDSARLMEALFKAYFEDAIHINQKDELSKIALAVFGAELMGEYQECIESDQFVEEVVRKDREVKTKLRITGVPFFVIGEQSFSGAQPAAFLAEVLEDQK